MDRLGEAGVTALLGAGREDESGDYTKGAGLELRQIKQILPFVTTNPDDEGIDDQLMSIAGVIGQTKVGEAGIKQLKEMFSITRAAGYDEDRICFDSGIVRGLDYYTGPVFEAQLTFKVKNEEGQEVVFGSVAGGGRYDDLVARFIGQQVPATGISIGVSRLLTALTSRGLVAM
jgi:histidyl-tRNA synthetase